MSWLYRTLVRPLLFARDSEEIHDRALAALRYASNRELLRDAAASFFAALPLPVELLGLRFPNPVGLAAGMDKHAVATPIWPSLGFGFAELGGVTWLPQEGNPPPRVFRAVPDEALINRMGFNNPGAVAVAETLAHWRATALWPAHPVAINLGKSKATPLNHAAGDYASSFRVLKPHADFFVVNVSSPNTPNLRTLQDKEPLNDILAALQELNRPPRESKPILVKVAPDLSFEALDAILELVQPRATTCFLRGRATPRGLRGLSSGLGPAGLEALADQPCAVGGALATFGPHSLRCCRASLKKQQAQQQQAPRLVQL
jgi:dihydroorotate dehydrogenase